MKITTPPSGSGQEQALYNTPLLKMLQTVVHGLANTAETSCFLQKDCVFIPTLNDSERSPLSQVIAIEPRGNKAQKQAILGAIDTAAPFLTGVAVEKRDNGKVLLQAESPKAMEGALLNLADNIHQLKGRLWPDSFQEAALALAEKGKQEAVANAAAHPGNGIRIKTAAESFAAASEGGGTGTASGIRINVRPKGDDRGKS